MTLDFSLTSWGGTAEIQRLVISGAISGSRGTIKQRN
jgi:hypothetical protein